MSSSSSLDRSSHPDSSPSRHSNMPSNLTGPPPANAPARNPLKRWESSYKNFLKRFSTVTSETKPAESTVAITTTTTTTLQTPPTPPTTDGITSLTQQIPLLRQASPPLENLPLFASSLPAAGAHPSNLPGPPPSTTKTSVAIPNSLSSFSRRKKSASHNDLDKSIHKSSSLDKPIHLSTTAMSDVSMSTSVPATSRSNRKVRGGSAFSKGMFATTTTTAATHPSIYPTPTSTPLTLQKEPLHIPRRATQQKSGALSALLTPRPPQLPPPSPARSHELKIAYTEFHNSAHFSQDATSAFLGNDPSVHNEGLVWEGGRSYEESGGHMSAHVQHTSNNDGSNGGNGGDLQTVVEGVPMKEEVTVPVLSAMYDHVKSGEFVVPAVVERVWRAGPRMLGLMPTSVTIEGLEESLVGVPLLNERPVDFGNVMITYDSKGEEDVLSCGRTLVVYHCYLLEFVVGPGAGPVGYAQLSGCGVTDVSDEAASGDTISLTYNVTMTKRRTVTLKFGSSSMKRAGRRVLEVASGMGAGSIYSLPRGVKESNAASLGKGRFATVLKCRRVGEKKEVAVKIIDKAAFWKRVKMGCERSDTLVRELSTSALCASTAESAKYFVRVQGCFENFREQQLFIEMEYIEGKDLFQVLKSYCDDRLREEVAKNYLYNVLTALNHLRTLGVAHRDVKLANIMATIDGDETGIYCKIGDFGMANTVDSDGLVRGRCGTPGYVAPEILTATAKSGYKNRVDVFSAGVVLYTLLCGYEPFYGETDKEVVAANKAAVVEFHELQWAKISDEAKDLIGLLLEKDPEVRIHPRDAMKHAWFDDANAKKLHKRQVDEALEGGEEAMFKCNIL